MKLNAKLVIIMLSLLVIAMLTLFVMNQYSQNELVQEIQESSTEVSKAIQLSVEDLTSGTDSRIVPAEGIPEGGQQQGDQRDQHHQQRRGDHQLLRPGKGGQTPRDKETGKGAQGSRARERKLAGSSMRPYDLVVPVIVGDEQLGYVQINLLLDNIREIQHANFLRRLAVTCLIFMLGIFLTIFLARRYTDPIHRLVAGVKKVSAGDLSVTFPGGEHGRDRRTGGELQRDGRASSGNGKAWRNGSTRRNIFPRSASWPRASPMRSGTPSTTSASPSTT